MPESAGARRPVPPQRDAASPRASSEAPSGPMLEVNGQPWPWRADLTLDRLVAERADAASPVSTAVNGLFVPRPQRADTALAPGDSVLIFSAIVGG